MRAFRYSKWDGSQANLLPFAHSRLEAVAEIMLGRGGWARIAGELKERKGEATAYRDEGGLGRLIQHLAEERGELLREALQRLVGEFSQAKVGQDDIWQRKFIDLMRRLSLLQLLLQPHAPLDGLPGGGKLKITDFLDQRSKEEIQNTIESVKMEALRALWSAFGARLREMSEEELASLKTLLKEMNEALPLAAGNGNRWKKARRPLSP